MTTAHHIPDLPDPGRKLATHPETAQPCFRDYRGYYIIADIVEQAH